jgi:hypothetical protein
VHDDPGYWDEQFQAEIEAERVFAHSLEAPRMADDLCYAKSVLEKGASISKWSNSTSAAFSMTRDGLNQVEIGEKLCISRCRVAQLLARAIEYALCERYPRVRYTHG